MGTGVRGRLAAVVMAVIATSCTPASQQTAVGPSPTPAATAVPNVTLRPPPADIVRAGMITVGINPINRVIVSGKNASGEPQGIAPDMLNEVARRMGVKVGWYEYQTAPQVVPNVLSGAWDIALTVSEPYPSELDFVGYVELDHTLLLAPGSTIRTFADADKAGVRIVTFRDQAPHRNLARVTKSASIVLVDSQSAQLDVLRGGGADALATSREQALTFASQFPGSRVLDDRYGFTIQSFSIKPGRAELLAYLKDFVAEAKTSGLVQQLITKHGVRGVKVAQ